LEYKERLDLIYFSPSYGATSSPAKDGVGIEQDIVLLYGPHFAKRLQNANLNGCSAGDKRLLKHILDAEKVE